MLLNGYNYPGEHKPFAHQEITANFMASMPRAFCFNDIGTGKTYSIGWAADFLMKQDAIRKILIVGTISTLDIVWKRTFFHIAPSLDISILKGSATNKRAMFRHLADASGKGIRIINPESLHIIADMYNEFAKYDLIIVDESAGFRNPKARKVKALNAVMRNHRLGLWCLTGSPTPEAPTDIYCTGKLIAPERFNMSFTRFKEMIMIPIDSYRWVPRKDAYETIAKMLEGYVIRFRRQDCLDLPPTQVETIHVEMTKEQTALLKKLRQEAAAMVEKHLITAVNEADVINKMLQVTGGAVKARNEDDELSLAPIDCSPKFAALEDIVEGSSGPIILYTPYLGAIARLVQWAEAKGLTNEVVFGDTKPVVRTRIFDDFQKDKFKLLIAHPQAMAHGLTLTRSNVVVWWTPTNRAEIYEQANGRITRPGQERLTYIVNLVCSELETKVINRNVAKASNQGLLLDYLAHKEL